MALWADLAKPCSFWIGRVKIRHRSKRMAGQAIRIAWLSGGLYVRGPNGEPQKCLPGVGWNCSGESKDKGTQAWLLGILGDLSTRHSPSGTKDAEAYYRQALALAREFFMRPLQAHCHLGLGNVHGKTEE